MKTKTIWILHDKENKNRWDYYIVESERVICVVMTWYDFRDSSHFQFYFIGFPSPNHACSGEVTSVSEVITQFFPQAWFVTRPSWLNTLWFTLFSNYLLISGVANENAIQVFAFIMRVVIIIDTEAVSLIVLESTSQDWAIIICEYSFTTGVALFVEFSFVFLPVNLFSTYMVKSLRSVMNDLPY